MGYLDVGMDIGRCFFPAFAATFRPVIPQHVIDRVLQNINLPEFIGETVTLADKSGSHEGLCPFHAEDTPSFKVFSDHYHCFGCGAHGNAIEFLMEQQGLSFPEAVRALASRSGVEVPSSERANPEEPDALSGARDVLRRACAKYQQLLLGPNGAAGLKMLVDRGIEYDAIVRFGIGYAPDSRSTLSDDRSFAGESLIAGGLAVPRREKKGCYDFFRNRIQFPVRNDAGDVIGFGGRRIGKDGPKYLNTAETELYQKGRILFGLQQARPAIRMTRSIIVCEGFFDVITPAQAGIEHIVSTCGTALTETQAEMVLSLADRVFFCFDGDSAGVKATWRAAEMLVPLASDRHEVRLCRLPAGEDPDSYVRSQGIASFQQALDASPTLTAYLIGEVTRGARIPEARAKSLSVAAALWRQFAAPGLALFFRQYACEALKISVEEFDRLAVTAPRRAGDTHIRPCPSCGWMAMLISNDSGYRIECCDCGLTTKLTATEAECRSLWNRREKPRQ